MCMKTSLFFIAFFSFCALSAQNVLKIKNPSFENPAWTNSNSNFPGAAPPNWTICSVVANASTSIGTTPDAYPLVFGPSDGGVYMGLYCNGQDSINPGGEGIYQNLCLPILKDSVYTVKIDVRMGNSFGGAKSSYIGLYGANAVPANAMFVNPELLSLILVDSAGWKTITCSFKPKNNYNYFIIAGNNSNGNGFPPPYAHIDNLQLTDSVCSVVVTAQSQKDSVCVGSCTQITATAQGGTPPISYSWSNGNTGIGPHTVCPVSDTVYTVTATDANGLSSTSQVSVFVSALSANAGPDRDMCDKDSVMLWGSGQNYTGFFWYPHAGLLDTTVLNPGVNVNSNTTYLLTMYDNLGCAVTDTVVVTAECGCDLSLPNVFTPNGDGINDYFSIGTLVEGTVLKIYNRWGQIVYENSSYDNKWMAENLNSATYYYSVVCPGETMKTGYVQVLKD